MAATAKKQYHASVGNRIAIIILEGGRYDRGWSLNH